MEIEPDTSVWERCAVKNKLLKISKVTDLDIQRPQTYTSHVVVLSIYKNGVTLCKGIAAEM
jgi:hypothetical protein